MGGGGGNGYFLEPQFQFCYDLTIDPFINFIYHFIYYFIVNLTINIFERITFAQIIQ